MDIGSMPEWAHASVMENVLYTRNLLAANPDILKDDGSVDLSSMSTTPMMIPADVTAALQNAASADGASGSSDSAAATGTAASSPDAAASTGTSESQSTGNGAGSLAASKMLVGVVAVVATVFLL